jgi:NADH:ubiquinone oxidoreductase subunit 6 (subunit J)
MSVGFLLLSGAVLLAAGAVVALRNLTYAALALAGTLIGAAGLFVLLSAEFLAAVQVLIYAGAVVTLILFAIMFAQSEPPEAQAEQQTVAKGPFQLRPVKWVTAMVGGGLLAFALARVDAWWALPTGGDDFARLGEALFGPYLLAFELLSLLLLVALIGAVVLARRE